MLPASALLSVVAERGALAGGEEGYAGGGEVGHGLRVGRGRGRTRRPCTSRSAEIAASVTAWPGARSRTGSVQSLRQPRGLTTSSSTGSRPGSGTTVGRAVDDGVHGHSVVEVRAERASKPVTTTSAGTRDLVVPGLLRRLEPLRPHVEPRGGLAAGVRRRRLRRARCRRPERPGERARSAPRARRSAARSARTVSTPRPASRAISEVSGGHSGRGTRTSGSVASVSQSATTLVWPTLRIVEASRRSEARSAVIHRTDFQPRPMSVVPPWS